MQLLEATSSRIGTFDLRQYFKAFGHSPVLDWADMQRGAASVAESLKNVPIHPALALSALAREQIAHARQREQGAYYTDFRLAALVAKAGTSARRDKRPVIDPACGSGMLLCALTLEACGHDRRTISHWLANSVFAADTSAAALRGACLALASLTDDLESVVSMRGNWFEGDSLLRSDDDWLKAAPDGFGVVVANPPWEKLKVLRPEFAKAQGARTHYGAAQSEEHLAGIDQAKRQVARYARLLTGRYPLAVGSEVDLFAVFTELFLRLARNGGAVSALLPAGLIRSQSTGSLRRELVEKMCDLSVGILDNHARFFHIDTRFKFVLVTGRTTGEATQRLKNIHLTHYKGTDLDCVEAGAARIPLSALRRLRPDLSVPEVRSSAEWRLFAKAAARGAPWEGEDGEWSPTFCREVDMTRERPKFRLRPGSKYVPVVEGRMVHQHRFGAKGYLSGSGRRAAWKAMPFGASTVRPQFFIAREELTSSVLQRIEHMRAGFCDIAGQTNERSMMAALIPSGVVCGNKVPTLTFRGPDANARLLVWLGMVNSVPFDWLLRRVLTTTVNYFLLRSVPLPNISPDSLPGITIAKAVREIHRLDTAGPSITNAWRAAQLRAEVDVLCLRGYGLGFQELQLMLEDFPSLDRAQSPIFGESKSTITRDFLSMVAAKKLGIEAKEHERRVKEASRIGALPYVPSQIGNEAMLDDECEANTK
jgi:hypothetical protein